MWEIDTQRTHKKWNINEKHKWTYTNEKYMPVLHGIWSLKSKSAKV